MLAENRSHMERKILEYVSVTPPGGRKSIGQVAMLPTDSDETVLKRISTKVGTRFRLTGIDYEVVNSDPFKLIRLNDNDEALTFRRKEAEERLEVLAPTPTPNNQVSSQASQTPSAKEEAQTSTEEEASLTSSQEEETSTEEETPQEEISTREASQEEVTLKGSVETAPSLKEEVPKLQRETPNKERTISQKTLPKIGETWRPKDPRRKASFKILDIINDTVHTDDGRTVKLERLRRYVKVC